MLKGWRTSLTPLKRVSGQVVMKPEELAKLLFQINPDVFGGRLENAEKWLQERLEETSQEMGKEQENEMRRFLAGFPTTTAH